MPMIIVKPQPSLRPDKSAKALKSIRPQKSMSKFNFIKSHLATLRRNFVVLGTLILSLMAFAAQAEYVQVTCTNRAGIINFKKALLIGAEYQLDNLLLWIHPDDEKFTENLKFLTTIPENKKRLDTRLHQRRHTGCTMGVCQYVYARTYFPQNQKPVKITHKAQFCANNPTAVKLRQVLNGLASYAVED